MPAVPPRSSETAPAMQGDGCEPQRLQQHFLLPGLAKEFPEFALPTSIRRLTRETDGVGRAQQLTPANSRRLP